MTYVAALCCNGFHNNNRKPRPGSPSLRTQSWVQAQLPPQMSHLLLCKMLSVLLLKKGLLPTQPPSLLSDTNWQSPLIWFWYKRLLGLLPEFTSMLCETPQPVHIQAFLSSRIADTVPSSKPEVTHTLSKDCWLHRHSLLCVGDYFWVGNHIRWLKTFHIHE